ncbi:MAG: hypothetical protein RLN86_00010 [Cyclobacteriaceae bacterium]
MTELKTITVALILIAFYSCNRAKQGAELEELSAATRFVNRSIEAHGGMDAWRRINAISYLKTTILYDSSGTEESKIVQRHNFRLKPEIEGTISWTSDSDSVKIVYEGGQGLQYSNGAADSTSTASATNTVLASLYVLFQPFKLLDEGTQLELIESVNVWDKKVNQIRPIYNGAKEGDDQWLFCFDSENDLLISNIVNHNGRISFIENLAFDSTTELLLHQHRKSYFVDSTFTSKYLRAEYYYTDYTLTLD